MAVTALTLTDITNVDIDTTRGSHADAWNFSFDGIDDVTNFGDIDDNADSFRDGSSGAVVALKIAITGGTETVAIQDFDFITITGAGGNLADVSPLVVWLPALTGDDVLYVDTDGNTWYDEELSDPAGGLQDLDDSFTPADALFVATEILSDSFTPSDALDATTYIDVNVSDSIKMNETFSALLKELTMYLSEDVYMDDSLSALLSLMTMYLSEDVYMGDSLNSSVSLMTMYLNETLFVDDITVLSLDEDFTEDTQVDSTWVEI